MKMETKYFNGKVIETKQETRNGVPIGVIAGYIATWDLDRCGDQFVKGCFLESLKEHKKKNRQIRFKGFHGKLIGGFPIETVKEDDTGLFGRGEVNLNTQQGKEIFSLAEQGVIVDLSIGFSAVEREFKGDDRIISKAIVWEGSAVDEPMNEKANITEVKDAIHDASNVKDLRDALSSLGIIDVELIDSVINFIEKKINHPTEEEIKALPDREFEEKLMAGIKFSAKSAKTIISALKAAGHRDGDDDGHRDGEDQDWSGVLSELKRTKQLMEEK